MKMNREKITLLLVALLLLFCTLTLRGTRRVHDKMSALAAQAQAFGLSDDINAETAEAFAPMIDRLNQEWERCEPMVSTYSRHDEVERVSENIRKLRALYDNGELTELNITLSELGDSLDHLLQTELPTIANIL